MRKHVLKLYKLSQRSLNTEVVTAQLRYGIDRALAGNRGSVWSASKPRLSDEPKDGEKLYCATITFHRNGRVVQPDIEERGFNRIKEIVERALRSKGWTLNGESPSKAQQPEGKPEAEKPTAKIGSGSYAEVKINLDPGDYFSHLFDRENQVSLVLSAVEEYTRSNFSNRFHCVLYGEPACGKTDILRSLSKMLGSDAVMHFDATASTAAGAKQLLLEASHIPPVLCIEEIEKADEQSLRWLLGVLDYRSEVRALKYRAGLQVKEVKLLCLATVNDFALFNKMMDGALDSRFSHKIYCPRPNKDTLRMILQREIAKSEGDERWIEPALNYCVDVEGTNDPRRIITVCLCGRERLLTGEYQRVLAATRTPKVPTSSPKSM